MTPLQKQLLPNVGEILARDPEITEGFCTAGAETITKCRDNVPISLRTILLPVDSQTASSFFGGNLNGGLANGGLVQRRQSGQRPFWGQLFVQFYFNGRCTCEKKLALSLKRHLFPHGDRVKMLARGVLDLLFDAAPHLEYVFQLLKLGTKAAFAKAAFDTLRRSPSTLTQHPLL